MRLIHAAFFVTLATPVLAADAPTALGESIGDLAGAKIAHLGFKKAQEGKGPAPAIDGFTPEQQFFIAWESSAATP
jgi:putative endopeptidase